MIARNIAFDAGRRLGDAQHDFVPQTAVIPGIIVGGMALSASAADGDNLTSGYLDGRFYIGNALFRIVLQGDGHQRANLTGISISLGEINGIIRAPAGKVQIQCCRVTARSGQE